MPIPGVLDQEERPAHPDRRADQLHQRPKVPAHPSGRLGRVEPQGLQTVPQGQILIICSAFFLSLDDKWAYLALF